MKQVHEVTEDEGDDGIFHNPVAIGGLLAGTILRMSCRWCLGNMVMRPSTAADAEIILNPDTGEQFIETAGLLCPTCDAPAERHDWGGE